MVDQMFLHPPWKQLEKYMLMKDWKGKPGSDK